MSEFILSTEDRCVKCRDRIFGSGLNGSWHYVSDKDGTWRICPVCGFKQRPDDKITSEEYAATIEGIPIYIKIED